MKFDQVERSHILQAVSIFEEQGPPKGLSRSNYYDVIIEGERFPPKPIIAYANQLATGKEPGNYFSGGENTSAFNAFERLGFEVVKKEEGYAKADLESLLSEFAKHAEEWFRTHTWLTPRYQFYQEFFKPEKIATYSWEDFQKLRDNLHSFQSLAIAGQNALGNPNLPIERYREIFRYLVSEKDSIDVTIDNLFKKHKGNYHLPYFGEATICELMMYALPAKYSVLNSRSKAALEYLGIPFKHQRGDTTGQDFLKFNEGLVIVREAYQEIVGQRTQTTLPLEVDQFFSWLYEKKIGVSTKFKRLMEEVGQLMVEEDAELQLDLNHRSGAYAWFIEKHGSIGSTVAHFEANRKGEKLWLWLHFEDQATKHLFAEKILYLPNGYQWSDWYKAKSIKFEEGFKIAQPDSAQRIAEALIKMQNDLSPLINPILAGMSTKDRNFDISPILKEFINQAQTESLKTKHYPKKLDTYDLKVSFGQGGLAKVPWISILRPPNTTSKGIYPVYLYFKKEELLLLSYGISESDSPEESWDLGEVKTISHYLEESGLERPDRYGDSFFFKSYQPNALPSAEVLNSDLSKILDAYDKVQLVNSGDVLKSLYSFNPEELSEYLQHFSAIVREFNLKPGDPRITYTLSNNRINMTVGQRYSWILHKAGHETPFGVISDKKISAESKEFTGSSHVNYYTELSKKDLNPEVFNSNLKAIALELKRTTKSSFRSSNQADLEHYLFEQIKPMESKKISAQNLILYGPPGTGKTFKLKEELFPKYRVKETSLSPEQHFTEVVQDLSWYQVIALALLEEGRSKVQAILENRWVQTKDALSASKNVRATIWGSLQSHTIRDCEYVNYKSRTEPLVFNKDQNSYWELVGGSIEEHSPELLEVKAKVDDFEANPDQEIRRYVFTTFHQAFSYEDFIEGIKPVMDTTEADDLSYEIADGVFKRICIRAKNDPSNRYAIFIDEINRGNIANIFGELITLIESDKRSGMPNALSVTLPYSKQSFSVPANLDIIGTMNTADRSVEALDTALRRRFNFQEMMPEPSLIDKVLGDQGKFEGIHLSEILKTINNRIEKLVDRDHTIGHAYFLKLKGSKDLRTDLVSIFCDNIIPLLQEYFYNDYPKIGLVLGAGFIEKKQDPVRFAEFKSAHYVDEYASRDVYQIRGKKELLAEGELEEALKLLVGKND